MDRTLRLLEMLRLQPGDSFLQHALALEYIKTGNEPVARQLFEAILANEPGYIGSYYHLGKLLEREGAMEAAIAWYEKGMAAAKTAGDNHSYGELRGAYDDLVNDNE
ncbi:MAG: hypothetical protein ABI813_10865 [Bacteroidota bacterium]